MKVSAIQLLELFGRTEYSIRCLSAPKQHINETFPTHAKITAGWVISTCDQIHISHAFSDVLWPQHSCTFSLFQVTKSSNREGLLCLKCLVMRNAGF